MLPVSKEPLKWDDKHEQEFRKLALQEARGCLLGPQIGRLEELNRQRNLLLHPQSSEEIMTQIRKDRMLDKMNATLREYVQFQENKGRARATT